MKILYVTTISNTMTFFVEHIKMLMKEGHTVDLACSSALKPVNPVYKEIGCNIYDIPFSRSPLSRKNLTAYRMLKHLIETGHYDIVHTHTPNASMLTRLACRKVRKQGTKVFYTAHGFHFFKGAPIKNWLLFYPVEKICAKYTDVLITINKEDYALAQKKMHASKVYYVPGVGVDLQKIREIQSNRDEMRSSMGVPKDCILLLSIGELNCNKNHQIVVRALANLKNSNVHYAVAGVGNQHDELLKLAKSLGVGDRFHLLGYRTDALKLYKAADVFVFPSFREGLSVSMMEAMACGLPIVCSEIRGNVDLVQNGKGGFYFKPDNLNAVQEVLEKITESPDLRKEFGLWNGAAIENFGIKNVLANMKDILL
ncbi:glycosyltransferase family 4 protein [Fibrobacter sp.]|uniref:glycosyltransferase family 4 protein n=1 Tax=Fibrobacter sp. TaxID=35828 RepID=UPI0038684AFF